MVIDDREDTDAPSHERTDSHISASAVAFDHRRDMLVVTMRSGSVAMIPRALIPFVAHVAKFHAADVKLSPMGHSIRFPSLDADFAVPELLRHAFGVNEATGS
jgi:hypothetical protein